MIHFSVLSDCLFVCVSCSCWPSMPGLAGLRRQGVRAQLRASPFCDDGWKGTIMTRKVEEELVLGDLTSGFARPTAQHAALSIHHPFHLDTLDNTHNGSSPICHARLLSCPSLPLICPPCRSCCCQKRLRQRSRSLGSQQRRAMVNAPPCHYQPNWTPIDFVVPTGSSPLPVSPFPALGTSGPTHLTVTLTVPLLPTPSRPRSTPRLTSPRKSLRSSLRTSPRMMVRPRMRVVL